MSENNTDADAKILVVDDEQGIRDMLSYELGLRGYKVATAANGAEALERVKGEKFQLVISDIRMPRMDGMEMLDAIKKTDPAVEVIMSTGYGTIETAVSAMKMGAYDFVQKPFNLSEIFALIEKALEKNELKIMLGVYETSKAVLSSLKLDELLPIMARSAMRVLKADDASIMLPDPEGRLAVAATAGCEDLDCRNACLSAGERVAGRVAEKGEPVIINGPLAGDPRFSGIPELRAVCSSIVYPLSMAGRFLGVLNVNRAAASEPFTAADLRYATIFCSHISQALNNASLYRELEGKIKEIRDMQSQLVQSEKLAAIGQFSAGIAHEINNPLGGIMGFADLVLKSGGLTPQQREDIESILQQSRRCGDIVKNLLQFSRRKKAEAAPVDLAAVLDASLQLVGFELRRAGVTVARDFKAGLPRVTGDAGQLQQVFINLIMNAQQALEGRTGGELRISAAAESGFVVVRFRDNGPGIPPGNLEKVFEPFFSTKPAGKGTGLGLSVSYGIVRQHGGSIRAESREGEGAEFIVSLQVTGDAL